MIIFMRKGGLGGLACRRAEGGRREDLDVAFCINRRGGGAMTLERPSEAAGTSSRGKGGFPRPSTAVRPFSEESPLPFREKKRPNLRHASTGRKGVRKKERDQFFSIGGRGRKGEPTHSARREGFGGERGKGHFLLQLLWRKEKKKHLQIDDRRL